MGVNNNYNSNKRLVHLVGRWKMMFDSLKKNYLLTIVIIIQIVAFSILYPSNPNGGDYTNILFGFITFILSALSGYYVHVFSHLFDYEDLYMNIYNSSTIVGRVLRKLPRFIQYLISKFVYLLDFHDKIHHDTNINKRWYNLLIEGIMNIYTEGVALILLFKGLDFGIHIRGYVFKMNYSILFAWSIMYATIHNINYNIITPVCHFQHHLDESTNYGIDFLDILLGSKYDNIPEEMNHAALNIILIMIVIIIFKDFYKPSGKYMIQIYNYIYWFMAN